MASARLAIAWLVLSPLLFRYAPLIRKHWLPLLGTGVLGNGIPAFLFATAQSRIDSSLSGMLNSLTPLFTLLAGALLFGTRIRGMHVAGILLGLAGAVGLIYYRSTNGAPAWEPYAVLPIVGTVCYGISGNIVKKHLYMLPAAATAVLALTMVGPWGLLGVFLTDLPSTLASTPHAWRSLGFVALLATLSSALSLVLWNALLKRSSAVWASSVTYLMPVVAIGWGLYYREAITAGQWGMVGVVFLGVYLVSQAERKV
jgi:drug/metabolite transporter (DMT)-like permease